jgi:hypothetical protein
MKRPRSCQHSAHNPYTREGDARPGRYLPGSPEGSGMEAGLWQRECISTARRRVHIHTQEHPPMHNPFHLNSNVSYNMSSAQSLTARVVRHFSSLGPCVLYKSRAIATTGTVQTGQAHLRRAAACNMQRRAATKSRNGYPSMLQGKLRNTHTHTITRHNHGGDAAPRHTQMAWQSVGRDRSTRMHAHTCNPTHVHTCT